ncbi:MAG TPA: hypothetical protein VF998_09535 [Candidatus Limnocylindria bacterium]
MNPTPDLATLEASGLIKLASLEPELEYLFRHALVQDAAYGSLLKQERRRLHARAAEVLLSTYPDRRRELAGVIALHFEQAGEMGRAVEHLVVAGEHALERFANREAMDFFERAFTDLPDDDARPDAIGLKLRAAIGAAKAGWTFESADKFVDRLTALLPRAEGQVEPRVVADGYFWNAFLRQRRDERPETSPELRHALERASEIGEALGDPVARAIPQAFVGMFMVFTGRLREGTAILESVLPAIEQGGDILSAALLADGLTMAYAQLGEFEAAEHAVALARRLAEKGDPIARLDAMIATASIALERGDLKEGLALASTCAQQADELGAVACAVGSNILLGLGRLSVDDVPGAKPPLVRGHDLSLLVNMPGMRNMAQAGLTAIDARVGDIGATAGGWERALGEARALGDPFQEAIILRQRALGSERGPSPDRDAVLKDLVAAIELLERIEARPELARALRDQARVLDALGRADEAKTVRERSTAIARELDLHDF